jgi:hypothetical protein
LIESGEQATFDWSLCPPQRDFLLSDHEFTVYSGGFGTGKTTALCAKVIWLLLAIPNNLGYLGRMDGKALRASTLVVLEEMLPKSYIAKKNDQQGFMQLVDEVGGSKLVYGDLKDLRDLKNLPLGFFAIDQMEEVPLEVWHYLVGRLRRRIPILLDGRLKQYRVAGVCTNGERHYAVEGDLKCRVCQALLPPYTEQLKPGQTIPDWDVIVYKRYGFGVCNPEGPSHWIFQHFRGLPGPNGPSTGLPGDTTHSYAAYHATAWDGMRAGFTDATYLREMEQLYKSVPLMWDRYLEGKWVEAEGLVYPGFRRETHVLPTGAARFDGRPLLEDGLPLFEFIDHGLTAPTAVGWIVLRRCECGCGKMDYYLIDEYYMPGMTVSYHAFNIKARRETLQRFRYVATYLDHHAFSRTLMGAKGTPRENDLYSVADEYLDRDIICLPTQKDWDAGYNRINELLASDPSHLHPVTGQRGAPHLYVMAGCRHFIEEIENYRWKKVRNVLDMRREEPQDGNDHLMDGLNGFLTSRPEDSSLHPDPTPIETTPAWVYELDELDAEAEKLTHMGV